jgi:hypothetical protein
MMIPRTRSLASLQSRSPVPRLPSAEFKPALAKSMSTTKRLSHRASFDSSSPATYLTSRPNSVAVTEYRASSSQSIRMTKPNRLSSKLGPGYYFLPETDKGPGFEFSKTNRFEGSYLEKIERKD